MYSTELLTSYRATLDDKLSNIHQVAFITFPLCSLCKFRTSGITKFLRKDEGDCYTKGEGNDAETLVEECFRTVPYQL